MSFFGGGAQEQQPAQPDPLFAAQTEMEMYTTLFNKLTTTCFSKCVSRKHKQDDLALGETSCIDRCVAKYMASQQKIGTVLQKANEAQMEQAQRMQQMQQAFGG